jgi:O-methyltransferase involved in polyketide biosynthesis
MLWPPIQTWCRPDPIVLAHARALLASSSPGRTSYVDADVRDTSWVLGQAAAALDFSVPVAVILVSVLHMIQDHDDPNAIVNRLMDAVPPGSFLVLTHVARGCRRSTQWGGVGQKG